MTRSRRLALQCAILVITGLLLAWRFTVIQRKHPNAPPALHDAVPSSPAISPE